MRPMCTICGGSFTDEQWDARHSDEWSNDVHEWCCPECNGREDPRGVQ